jgi:hypothetical protein
MNYRLVLAALGLGAGLPLAIATAPRQSVPASARRAMPAATFTVTLEALADTAVTELQPAANFGRGPVLQVGRWHRGVEGWFAYRSLVRFDTTLLPRGASLAAARLRLRVSGSMGNQPMGVAACSVTGAWDELAVTWANQPTASTQDCSPMEVEPAPSPQSPPITLEWDVTELVRTGLASPAPDYGLLLSAADEQPRAGRAFHSRENTDGPRLIVVYQPQAGQPTPTVALAPTATPTGMPDRPVLMHPPEGVVMPQPLPPDTWYFLWDAARGACETAIRIDGPGGRRIEERNIQWQIGYEFEYSGDEQVPDDALGPWHWRVSVTCPQGGNASEVRTFWVQRGLTPTPDVTATPEDEEDRWSATLPLCVSRWRRP